MVRCLNIFTDASILDTNTPNNTVGCAGFIATSGESEHPVFGQDGDRNSKLQMLDRSIVIIPNCTNNVAEATGVLRAVDYAIRHKDQFDEINIFSDSQWCIKSLTVWIFNWISTIDQMGVMYNSSKDPVANQTIFNEIILAIVNTNTKIHFYHCKGHVKNNNDSIFNALKTFRVSNDVGRDVHLSYHHIYTMAYFNDLIDNYTRDILAEWVNGCVSNIPLDFPRPIFYILDRDIINRYKQLIS